MKIKKNGMKRLKTNLESINQMTAQKLCCFVACAAVSSGRGTLYERIYFNTVSLPTKYLELCKGTV